MRAARTLRQPRAFDRVHAARAVAAEKALDVVLARRLDRPERAARALAREPVRGHVLVVDRPDERLGGVVRLVGTRTEQSMPPFSLTCQRSLTGD